MALNPVSVRGAKEGERAHARGGEELDRKNRVDLADELVSNIDRGFSHGTSKLCNYIVSYGPLEDETDVSSI